MGDNLVDAKDQQAKTVCCGPYLCYTHLHVSSNLMFFDHLHENMSEIGEYQRPYMPWPKVTWSSNTICCIEISIVNNHNIFLHIVGFIGNINKYHSHKYKLLDARDQNPLTTIPC
jgi:hypothetical protein